jgi:hypothetical protein
MSTEELENVKGRQWEKWEDVDVSSLSSDWNQVPHADHRTSTDQVYTACERPGGGDGSDAAPSCCPMR